MKRTYFSVLLRSIFILACINGAAANNVNEHHDNSGFSSWTDERLREYNDSLKDCLYPVLETDSMIISEDHRITFSERDGEGVAKLVRSGKIPEIVTVDLSKEVGDIPIRSGVSQTGAKTYEVPIEVYPGMNGMTPRLALSYNSQRGSGTLGSGWALSGLPMITRGKRTLYYDGETREERMDTTDSFYLDGVRLIKTGVATGYIVYQTETGNIKAKGYVSGKNLKYFEVFYPDGKKGTFGSSSNYTSKFQYPVMQMKDLHGNTVEYRYLETDNIYRISSIQYNGYGGTVYFSYETNPNPVTMYAAGKKISHGYRISNISCRFGSSALRNYVLKYETYNNTTLLTEIGMTSGERSVNPLRFYYGAGKDATGFYKSDTRLTHWFKDVKPSDIKVVKGKFDYESGVEGIIIYPSFNPYFKFYGKDGNTGTRYSIFKNYISEDVKIFFYSGLKESDYSYPMPTLTTGKGFIDILCADLEGSQEESVIKVNNYVDAGKDRVVFTVYQKSAISGLIKKYERIFDFNTVYSNGQNQCVMPKFFYAGDFTGDGKMEILAVSAQDPLGISPSSFGTRCYLFDIEGNRLLYSDHGFEYVVEFVGTELTDGQAAYDKSDKLIPADYNGDGKTDICLVKSIGTVTYSFEKTAGGYELKPIANYTGLKKENLLYRDILFGEFNGDGLMDILISPTWNILSDSTWKVLYSKGDGQFESKSFSGIKNSNDQNIGFLLHDYDGDGKTDLVRYDSKGFDIYKWNGKSFSDNSVRTENASEDFKIVPTNLVSHNSFIRLIAIKDNTATKYLWPVNEGVETLVSGAANSSGIVEKTEYAMIDGSDTEFYLMDNKAQFPFVNIQEQLPVVFKTETRHGNAIAEQNTYRYENAVIHRQGLGFAGFSKTEVRNNRNQTLTHTYDPFNHSIPKGESGPGYEKNYMFRISVSSDKILRCDLTEKLEKDKLKGNSVKTTFTYDAYGYPVTEKSVFSDGTEIYKENTYLANTEVADGYYLGYKTGEKNTIKKDGKANTDNEVISSSDKMLPLVRYREKDGNRTEEITYTYDIHGNLSSETLKKYASVNLQKTQYVYDRYGRLTKKTDPLGRSTSYVYDALGRLGSETDFRRGKTEYGYDSFGRTVTTTYPDNTKDSVSYTWNSSVAGGLYVINSYSTGKPDKKEYYDARNRLIRSSELRFDGSYISVDRRYDGYGRLEKISLPFKGTVASYWNVNAYDSYDRQISQTEASGNKTTWSYSGNSVTTVMNKISTTKTYDARENLISVKDASGTVTYSYAPDGRLLSVTAPGNIVTSLTYDGYGRKISMTDPSSGTTTYSYDDDGNLSSQTDAEGKEISHEYDSYGRLLKTVSPGYSTSCTYDNNGDLTTVVTNGMTKTIEYDSLGRISKTKEFSIESKFLTKTYGYSDGSLTAIAYDSPTGRLGVEVREYENGHLRSIKYNGSHEIYRLDSENEFGQPTKVTTWDITREYTFSQYGYPTGRKFSKGSYVYQDFGYVFDPLTGNLTSRTDRKRNKTENFAYDGLNRLSTYDGNTVSYESNGNITRRSDVGSFTYSRADKPYALTGASAEESRIPTRQQDITYTAFGRPETISENRTTYSFVYNGDYDRVGMYKILGEQSVKAMVYLGGNYEADINVRTSVRSSGYGYEEMSYAEKLLKTGKSSKRKVMICNQKDRRGYSLLNQI